VSDVRLEPRANVVRPGGEEKNAEQHYGGSPLSLNNDSINMRAERFKGGAWGEGHAGRTSRCKGPPGPAGRPLARKRTGGKGKWGGGGFERSMRALKGKHQGEGKGKQRLQQRPASTTTHC